jgi:dynein intermediate chain 1, axonemal
MVCCFSLKNTAHPEYTFSTESGVMCLDFHPRHRRVTFTATYCVTSVCVSVQMLNHLQRLAIEFKLG